MDDRVQKILEVHHWNEKLFSFRSTRHPEFRFKNGQFTMIGLQIEGKILLRAYSMVSPSQAEHLEFLSIKVPDGALTSHLQHIQVGDPLWVQRKAAGTLILEHLLPGGKNLYLLSTGTGIAPFCSILQNSALYDSFEKVILCHGVRQVSELVYQDLFLRDLPRNAAFGEEFAKKFVYYPCVTREEYTRRGRITQHIEDGSLFGEVGLPPFSPERDRILLCGNQGLLKEVLAWIQALGFCEASSNKPGHYAIEKAFVER